MIQGILTSHFSFIQNVNCCLSAPFLLPMEMTDRSTYGSQICHKADKGNGCAVRYALKAVVFGLLLSMYPSPINNLDLGPFYCTNRPVNQASWISI